MISDKGLCIALYDLLHVKEGFIHQGEGYVRHQVKFRLLLFKPFPGEVLQGKIANITREGIEGTLLPSESSSSSMPWVDAVLITVPPAFPPDWVGSDARVFQGCIYSQLVVPGGH